MPEIPPPAEYHAIIVGRDPGVVEKDPLFVTENIKGVPGAIALKFDTKDEAVKAYQEQLLKGQVTKVTIITGDVPYTMDDFNALPGTDGSQIDLHSPKYHVVIIGRNPGIFPRGHNIQANLMGISGASSDRAATHDKAVEMFRVALEQGRVKKVIYDIHRVTLTA